MKNMTPLSNRARAFAIALAIWRCRARVNELLDRVVNWVGVLVLLDKQVSLPDVVLVAEAAEVERVAILQ